MSGLYIHIPFCSSKCPYCGFYSVTNADGILKKKYLATCIDEIKNLTHKIFDTIYVGGGTPSVLGAETLSGFLEEVLESIEYTGQEFTMELNPESADETIFAALSKLPVSRISMGVQSLNDEVLQKLGRIHSAETAVSTFRLARKMLKDVQINLDMIYDIPDVEYDIIKDTLQKLVQLAPDHISAYSYSPDTSYLGKKATDDPYQMENVIEALEKSGYRQYEISNFAKAGAASKHNLNYWRMKPYSGIGAGAHSLINDGKVYTRYCHIQDIAEYIADPAFQSEQETYTIEDIIKENIVFGLRMLNGIDLLELEKKYGIIPDDTRVKLNELAEKGLLKWKKQKVRATREGLLLLDSVMRYLW